MLKQRRRGMAIVLVAHAVGTAAIALLYPALGSVAGLFGLTAALVGAWCFGLRGGLITAAVQTVLNALVMQFLLDRPEPFTFSAALGLGFMFLAGAAVGSQRDLSRRLRDELARNERLRVREMETLAAIPDVMVRVRPDGVCLMQGMELPGGLAQGLTQVLGRASTVERQAAFAEVVARTRTRGQVEALTLEVPGTVTYDVRCLPAADASVLAVFRDVTEQRRLIRRVAAAESFASLGTLAAGLAHEVNNPLTYIITNIYTAKLLLGDAGAAVKTELNAALDGCWRIRDLVKNMLATTTSKQDVVEPVSVAEVVEAALALVRPQVRHRATIDWTPGEDLHADAHRTRLVQVMVNLVVNASQAFPDNRASTNEIRIRVHGEDRQVVIEVSDNGTGMDEDTKLRVLEPFFTTKAPGQGTGLGLFLSNSIVESLGGRLQIDSTLGQGTRVTVCLPMSKTFAVLGRKPADAESSDAVAVPRLRVLIIDDEPEIRRSLQRILSAKHDVALSSNGAQALERLRAGERYDVILCDLLMPEMTGIELFHELEEHFREQADRVVFLTGGATSESSRAFIEQQSARIVCKPFHPAEIMAAVMARARSPLPLPTPTPQPISQ